MKAWKVLLVQRLAGRAVTAALPMAAILATPGCGALSPSFVSLFDPTGGSIRIENATGHVVVTFVNNATVDERLLNYMESDEGGGLDFTEEERQGLRPRLRMRVRITFADGTSQLVEYIDGSSTLVDPTFNAESQPDLNQNDLNNTVANCDVASVAVEAGSAIDVFVPVPLRVYELVESSTTGGQVVRTFELRETIPPQFRALQADEVDEDGNVTARRNVGLRDLPSPTLSPLCGSVIAIVVDGVLSVPFLDGVDTAPSYDRDDPNTSGGVGGRYEFVVTVR